jgi:hypothetical protein
MYDGRLRGGWPLLPRTLRGFTVKKGRGVRRMQMGSPMGWVGIRARAFLRPLIVPDVGCAGLVALAHAGRATSLPLLFSRCVVDVDFAFHFLFRIFLCLRPLSADSRPGLTFIRKECVHKCSFWGCLSHNLHTSYVEGTPHYIHYNTLLCDGLPPRPMLPPPAILKIANRLLAHHAATWVLFSTPAMGVLLPHAILCFGLQATCHDPVGMG